MKRGTRKIGGWVCVSLQTTTTSTTGRDETQGANSCGCQNTSPHNDEDSLTHLSFACVQLDLLQLLLGMTVAGVSCLQTHGGCQR